ncbi:MAG: hypothetical protein ABIQ81_02795 [Novosphingobium sp.]
MAMFSLLFRNRWAALGWAALTLASVAAFVSTGGGADMITRSIRQIETQRKILAVPPAPARAVMVARPEPLPLQPIPGQPGDPANPKLGDVFIDPVTGQRLRVVRRSATVPAADAATYSSSAPSP